MRALARIDLADIRTHRWPERDYSGQAQ